MKLLIAIVICYLVTVCEGRRKHVYARRRNFDQLVLDRTRLESVQKSILLMNRATPEEQEQIDEVESKRCSECLMKTYLIKFNLNYFQEEDEIVSAELRLGQGLETFRDILSRHYSVTTILKSSCGDFLFNSDEPFCWRKGRKYKLHHSEPPLDVNFDVTQTLRYWKKKDRNMFRYFIIQYRALTTDPKLVQEKAELFGVLDKLEPVLAVYKKYPEKY